MRYLGGMASFSLPGAAVLWICAASFGYVTTAEAQAESSFHLPEMHSWDEAFLAVVTFLQFSRILLPLATCMSIGVLVIWALGSFALITGGGHVAFAVVVVTITCIPASFIRAFLWRTQVRTAYQAACSMGNKYLGLLTHGLMLRNAYETVSEQMYMPVFSRFLIIFAIMSWQEMAGCAAIAAWAVVAFTPEFFTSGSPWPFLDTWGWLLMQADFAWRTKASTAINMLATGSFGAVLLFRCFDWSTRRVNLQAVQLIRRDNVMHPALVSQPGDSREDVDYKEERFRWALDRADEPETVWERLTIPCPTLAEVLYATSILYGILVGVAVHCANDGSAVESRGQALPRQPEPQRQAGQGAGLGGSVLFVALLQFHTALMRFLCDWRFVALVAVAGWLLTFLYTRAKDRAWVDRLVTMRLQLALLFDQCMPYSRIENFAYAEVLRTHGPRPIGTWVRIRRALGVCIRLLLGAWWGSVMVSWVVRPGYLPAYAFPSYGGGKMAAGPGLSPSWFQRPPGGVGATGGSSDAAADGVWGWWAELRTAVRINLVAVRAWRHYGLDGVQTAMEALHAVRLMTTDASVRLEPEPGAGADAPALDAAIHREVQNAIDTLKRVQTGQLSDRQSWRIGGKWGLGLPWEVRVQGRRNRATARSIESDLEEDVDDGEDAKATGRRRRDKGGIAEEGGARESRGSRKPAVDTMNYDPASHMQCALYNDVDHSGRLWGPWEGVSSAQCAAAKSGLERPRRGQHTSGALPYAGEGAATKKAKARSRRPGWTVQSLLYPTANLLVAALIALWFMTGPDWLRSPEKFLDKVTGAVKGWLGPRATSGGRKAATDAQAPPSGRRKQQPSESEKRKAQQQQQQQVAQKGQKHAQQPEGSQKGQKQMMLALPAASPPSTAPKPADRTAVGGRQSGLETQAPVSATSGKTVSTAAAASKAVPPVSAAAAGKAPALPAGKKTAPKQPAKQRPAAAADAAPEGASPFAKLGTSGQPSKPTVKATAAKGNRRSEAEKGAGTASAAASAPAAASGVPYSPAASADVAAKTPQPPAQASSMSFTSALASALPFTATLASKARPEPPSASHPAAPAAASAPPAAVPPPAAAAWGTEPIQLPQAGRAAGRPAARPHIPGTVPLPAIPGTVPLPAIPGTVPLPATLQTTTAGAGSARTFSGTGSSCSASGAPSVPAAYGAAQQQPAAPRTNAWFTPVKPWSSTPGAAPPPAAAVGQPSRPPAVADDDDVPVPVPVKLTPAAGAASAAPPQHAAAPGPHLGAASFPTAPAASPPPPSSFSLLGYNPALADYLRRAAFVAIPAGQAAANHQPGPRGQGGPAGTAASTQADAKAPGGAAAGAADMPTGLCLRCNQRPRRGFMVHGNTVHLCLCRECGKAFKPETPCLVCGEPTSKLLYLA